jgi:hypothetical protein
MGWSNGRKVIIITSIHPSIHPSNQLPLKVCFNFIYICVCGGLDGLIGCEESLVQWLDVKKANFYDVHPSIHPSIQPTSIASPPPPPPPRCMFPFGVGWRLGRMDGLIWSGCEESLLFVTSYGVVTSVRPTISLKPANYFLFRNLTFFVFFVLFFCFGPSLFLPSLVSSHPGIPTITGLQLVMSWFRHVEKASF